MSSSFPRELGWGVFLASLVFALGVLCGARRALSDLLGREEARFAWSAVLADESQAEAVESALRNLPGFREVRRVPREAILAEALSDPFLKDRLDTLDANPFHTVFKVSWDHRAVKARTLTVHAETVRKWPGVDAVEFSRPQAALIEDLAGTLMKINIAFLASAWGLAFFVLIRVASELREPVPLEGGAMALGLAWSGLSSLAGFALAGALTGLYFLPLLALGVAVGLVRSLEARRKAPAVEIPRSRPVPSLH